jgi:hypothetical protein
MSSADYVYTENSRRRATIVVCFLCAGFVGFGAYYGAPWFALAPAGIALLMTVFMVIFNRVSGCNLVGDSVELYSGKWRHLLSLADISDVLVKEWSDGAPSVRTGLKSGKPIEVPAMCLGSVASFTKALERRSIPIVRSN